MNPDDEVLDLRRLRDIGDGDETFVREILLGYLVDMGARLEELARAVADEDGPGITRASHTIKGASANVGARALARLAETLEKRRGETPLPDQFGALEREFGRVRDRVGREYPSR